MFSFGFQVEKLIDTGRISKKNLEIIKEWCNFTKSIPVLTDHQISLYLIACDNNVEDAKRCILCCYKIRENAPELFDERDINLPELKQQNSLLKFSILEGRTPDNFAVVLIKVSDPSPTNYVMANHAKLMFMAFELAAYDDPPAGLIFISDMNGFSFGHLLKMKINTIRKILYYIQDGMMTKIKAIHLLNSNWYCQKLMAIARPFMYPDLLSKIYLHGPDVNMDEFFEKFVPKYLMPSNYGGTGRCVDDLDRDTIKRLEELTPFFKEEINQRKAIKKK